ncbi:uncharacterized protein [Nicotiana sylvestris]|uniref:uncharacterized protein n=1 Tax=Nicotiana sylvestris TaxID=4096 RepID=UPI00388C84D4
MRLGSQVIPKRSGFKYLGSVKEDGDIEEDATHRIGMGWMKWRLASIVLCDKKVSPLLKEEMRMLRWMHGHTRMDKIRNEDIRENVGVAPMDEKMQKARLR